MKRLILILLTTIIHLISLFTGTSFAQVHIVEKGLIRYGLKVGKGDKMYSMNSLCDGFDPETGVPINLVIPEGSGMGLEPAMLTDEGIESMGIIIDNSPPTYLNYPSMDWKGISLSAVPGSTHSYTLFAEGKGRSDTLRISWTVGYNKLELADLFPADYFSNYVARQFQYLFENYPDTSQYNWADKEYITELDARHLPVNPEFPYSDNGLYFVVNELTEDAKIQLIGFHTTPQSHDPDDPFALFLYEDLEPGDYEFVVWPHEGAPDNITLRYPFTILKPWWQAPTVLISFTLLGAVLFGGMFFGIYRSRQVRKTRRLEWEKQLKEAELKAIRAQLNPHFLFNALSSIQNLVSQDKKEPAGDYIQKLSRLLRQVLSSSEKQFHELEQELSLIRLYLELEKLRFSFSWVIDVEEGISMNTLVPVMFLQPYVENAVKHGVAERGQSGEIRIHVSAIPGGIRIEILDNGPGLNAPGELSTGLRLGESRIHHLNALYSGEARVEVRNREDTQGVRVLITLPLD